MSVQFIVTFVLTLQSIFVTSDTLFNITHATRYRMKTFTCVPNEDCRFECNNIAQIGSAESSGCSPDISVSAVYSYGSCECAEIHCSDGGYNCHIGCNRQNSCYHNKIYCGDNSICNVYCNDVYSCNHAHVHCGDNSTCNLYCHSRFSCQQVALYCGNNSNCRIYCNADISSFNGYSHECQSMIVYAQDSNSLSIDVYNNLKAAELMTVYAPNTGISSPTVIHCGINTFVQSNSQLSCNQMTIYSVEGWNDVQIQLGMTAADVFGDYSSKEHQMYCGLNNEYFCFGWAPNGNLMQCDSDITICNTYTLK
eukprot:367149_1